jgi:hypothetical protein
MRRFLLLTLITGAILAAIAGSVLQTLRLEGRGPLNVSSSDLLDAGTVERLGLQLVSVGGKVTKVGSNRIEVRDKHGRDLRISLSPKVVLLEGTTTVPITAIEVGAHVTTQALYLNPTYLAFKKVTITPHRRAIGGTIAASHGLLTIVSRRNVISLVRVLPGATITEKGKPLLSPLATRMHVVAQAYPDPLLQGIFLTSKVQVLNNPTTKRVGGIIASIDRASSRVVLYVKSDHANYTIEILPTTKITLAQFSSSIDDMQVGDHLTVTGKPDATNAGVGSNPLLAKVVRISSPSFGGVIATITPASAGGVVLLLKARHGHVLRIDAPGLAQVYAVIGGTQQNAHVPDLFVNEHISVRGTRIGKYEVRATAIHVYPHQHTVGGLVAGVLPGTYRITSSDGKQYIIHTTPKTAYTVNGKRDSAASVRLGLHVRVRGTDVLHNDQRAFPTIIAAHVSVTVHVHVVKTKKPTVKKSTTKLSASSRAKKSTSKRVGGLISSIDRARNRLVIYVKSDRASYTIEVLPTTTVTLGQFASGIADMQVGDHLTVTGKPDTANAGIGPNPLLARVVRINSPSFGGVIASITPAGAAGVVVLLKAHHGHVSRIDAPSSAQVYAVIGGVQQNAHAIDLFAGEHISVRGSRVGKFEIRATAIHVYPHQHTVGGTVTSVLQGIYRIATTDGKHYIVHATVKTVYTFNGKLSNAAIVRPKLHVRIRGTDALRDDLPGVPTILAAHVSVTVHIPVVHKKKTTVKKKSMAGITTALNGATAPSTNSLAGTPLAPGAADSPSPGTSSIHAA